ncbi:hypothetical protein ASC89_23455 [Devosia sp. Root413D1]|uniref:YdeI/OmpD-associated family protein n=1 Tax=Devosia sp. Root413D1 TaxID=1736531 RepID=UPI0006FCA89B|nr:YdeI/OmpD-associated family protein [Devosia sp. Root413D1]KQW75879.1 hypothetical protein ASC89_23455 [Devosia sp. Root413D1]
MKFVTTILLSGNNTGIIVPPQVRDALNGGKNPLVVVSLAGHTWRSKVATMGEYLLVGVSAEIRGITGVKGNETHEVELTLDDQPRIVEAPGDLQAALDADPVALAAWTKLAPSHKKAHVTAIEGAKAPETRLRRVQKAIEMLTT